MFSMSLSSSSRTKVLVGGLTLSSQSILKIRQAMSLARRKRNFLSLALISSEMIKRPILFFFDFVVYLSDF